MHFNDAGLQWCPQHKNKRGWFEGIFNLTSIPQFHFFFITRFVRSFVLPSFVLSSFVPFHSLLFTFIETHKEALSLLFSHPLSTHSLTLTHTYLINIYTHITHTPNGHNKIRPLYRTYSLRHDQEYRQVQTVDRRKKLASRQRPAWTRTSTASQTRLRPSAWHSRS
ncbi:MAG: hypothetical protein BYD32DRAFT_201801 [Podila humilis]|nr:MAG: hypothetical protein BYD32DRAFT_201801 [Podila humilis]